MSAQDRRLYVGNLRNHVQSKDIEDLFKKFKPLDVDLKKPRRGPPFAFLEFESAKDAEDALRRRNGYNLDGYRIHVKYPTRNGPRPGLERRRSLFQVKVTGIPPSGSWQDLKSHMQREAGEVCYADVKNGSGIVKFLRYDDMKYAIKQLDNSRFRSQEGEVSYIRVKKDSESRSRSRSPRSRSRSRSYSPAPKRSRGSAHRQSRSPSRSVDSRR